MINIQNNTTNNRNTYFAISMEQSQEGSLVSMAQIIALLTYMGKVVTTKAIILLLSLLMYIGTTVDAKAPSIYPEVGKPCPDFVLRNIEYYPKEQAELKDFKGKWLVLDFWTKYCAACVASFPKINVLQKEFGDKIQFMMVGLEDKENKIRTMYTKFRESKKLEMPCAFDSALFKRFNIGTCPYIIVIDDQGIVRGITYSINASNIKDLMAGMQTSMPKAYRIDETPDKITYDFTKPFLIAGNGGNDTDFTFRSLLSEWKSYMPKFSQTNIIDFRSEGRFQVLKVSISDLYSYAYIGQRSIWYTDSLYGKFWPFPILELRDSSAFKPNYTTGQGLYCYSLTVPSERATESYLKEVMQRDLQNYFDFKPQIKTRLMPYWKLVATDDARRNLLTKSGTTFFKEIIPRATFTAKNISIKDLLHRIYAYTQLEAPFIDETEINGNIDITVDAVMTDLNDVKKELMKYGLDLIRGEKLMKVLVIKD